MTSSLRNTGRRDTGDFSSSGGVLTAVAGGTAIAMAIYQVATPGPPTASFDTANDWLRELLFLGYLITSIGAVHSLHRSGGPAAHPPGWSPWATACSRRAGSRE